MTGTDCPDWRALRAVRDTRGSAESAISASTELDWLAALEHRGSCRRCADAALAAEPLLVFERLAPPNLDADEGERMRDRVAVARRLQRHQSRHFLRPGSLLRAGNLRRAGDLRRAGNLATVAAAAAFILAVTALGPRVGPRVESPANSVAVSIARFGEAGSGEPGEPEARRLATVQLGMLPLVEGATEISMLVGGESYDWVQVSFGR